MTVPNERTRAVLETRKFLVALAAGVMSQESPESLQNYGRMLLRHYPSAADGGGISGMVVAPDGASKMTARSVRKAVRETRDELGISEPGVLAELKAKLALMCGSEAR